jgi:hypothetical protein
VRRRAFDGLSVFGVATASGSCFGSSCRLG